MLRVAADHFADSDTGRQRRANEDAFFARAPVFAVADGMGGAQAGEIASRTAIDVLAAGIPQGGDPMEARLAAVVEEANDRVHGLSVSDERRAGMGTTLTVAHVGEDEVTVAHVGDSRLYRLRGDALEKLTQDHSLVDEYRRQGRLTEEEAENHPQRSIITRAIGPEPHVEVDTLTVPARAGEVFLVCSDGLTTMLPEREVLEVLRTAPTLQAAGRELIVRANDAGGRDNITVVLFRLEEVGTEVEPETAEHQATTVSQAVPAVQPSTAVAVAEPRVAPRAPRAPVAAAPPERPRRRVPVRGVVLGLVLWLCILVAGWFATQTVFFVGSTDEGFVAIYRGVPYEGPAGVDLFSVVYVSGVPAREASGTLVTGHELRSRDDAYDLVRALERGEVVRP